MMGLRHRAELNFGGCFAYTLAKNYTSRCYRWLISGTPRTATQTSDHARISGMEPALQPCVTMARTNLENKMSDRGPTVINTGRSSNAGWAVAVIIAVLAVGAMLMFTGVININGGGGTDVNVNVPAAGTAAPAAAPASDAAPSTAAPANAPATDAAPSTAAPSN
jgi:hypothetical protein